MDISITCNVSISKKLRALIGNAEANLTFITESIRDGRANAKMTLSMDDTNKISQRDLDDLLNKETSIMFTPTEVEFGVPASIGVTNIFSTNANVEEEEEQPIVNKIAATKAPEKKTDARYSIKNKQQIEKETPQEFQETKKPAFKKFITDLNQLIEAARSSENKEYKVDINSIKDPRKKAIALEEKEKAEAIDYPAFIVNETCANLTINDLGINLMLNVPFNLGNISAKRITASSDLKAMFRSNMVKFISPDEIQDYLDKVDNSEQIKSGLSTFSNHREAEAALERTMSDAGEEIYVGNEDLMRPTEQESLAMNITRSSSSNSNIHQNNGIRKTTHGMNNMRSQKTVPEESNKSAAGLKTIRRTGIEYR